jgi:predicted DCC family thiol-disulfide oxidoreductase YuxK
MVAWNRHWLPARRDLRTPVLLFDGECGLCDGVVRTLLREDEFGRIKFAALQSEPAQRFLAAHGLPATDFESLVFVRDCNDPAAGYSLRTTGVCDVLDEVGGICRILSWSRIIPRALRDVLYRGVARVRFAIFGRSNAAATASMAGPGRFLDR